MTHAEKLTDDEAFVNQRQLDYFRQKLLAWKNDLFKEANATFSSFRMTTDHKSFCRRNVVR